MYSRVGNAPPQYRQGVTLPVGPSPSAPPPVPTGMIAMPPPPHFTPVGMPASNKFSVPQFSGGFPRYPPPPPILAPPPPVSYSSMPPPYFAPPLPEEPPAEVPPPPPPSPPPSMPLDPRWSISGSQKLESFIAKSLPPEPESFIAKSLPTEPLKPCDPEILDNIERVAASVVKKGPRFESIERAKQAGDPKYAFLFESDEGPEASIAHTYYNWRKQTLEAQMGLEADHREGKLLDQEECWQTDRRKHLSKSAEDDLDSQAMLDMDMEDDAMLSGKVEMNRVPTKGQVKDIPGQSPSVKLLVAGSGNLTTTMQSLDSSIIREELAMSMNDEEATAQPAVMNMVKPAECKLTGEYRGGIIENYFSDNSDVSGDLEPTSPTLERLPTKSTVQGLLLRPPKKKLSYLPDFSEIDGEDGGVGVGSTALKSSGIKNSEDGLANEDDSHECPVGKCQKQSSAELMDSSSGEDQQSLRKKRKGRCQSRSNSRSPTSSTQRTQFHSASPGPHADVVKMISNIDEKEGRRELKIMERGKGGLGFNVCVNYARGRCFHGNSCRFLHQDKNASAQESAVQIEVLRAGSAEQDVEAENKAGDRLAEGTVEMANTTVEKNRNLSAIEEEMPFPGEKASLDGGKEVERANADVKEVFTSEEGRSKTNVAEKVEEEWSLPEDDDFVACPAWPSSLQQTEATKSLSQNDAPSSTFLPAQTQFLAVSSPPLMPPTNFITSSYTAGNFNSCSSHTVTSLHSVGAYMQPGFPRPPPVDTSMNFPNRNLAPSQGLHRDIPFSIHDAPPLHAPSMQPHFVAPFPIHSGFSQTTLQAFTPQNQPPSFSSFPQMPPQQRMSSAPTSYLTFSKHGSGASAPLSSYTQTFSGDISKPSMFSGASNGNLQETVYPKVPPVWSVSRPYDSTSLSSPGQPSSYSYNLTSIPPLPSIIKLPTSQDLTSSSDQYDPLSDSLDPGPTLPSGYVKVPEPLGGLPTTNAKENMSSGPELLNLTETLGDPVVGVVEDVSPPDDERTWSPPVGEEEGDPQEDEAKPKLRKQSAARGLKLLRSAIADHVKELLKPTWKEGRIHKDAFKTIVKKAVDKVTNNLPSHHIPKSQEKVIQFMATSRPKIAKLVQGYIDKYRKA